MDNGKNFEDSMEYNPEEIEATGFEQEYEHCVKKLRKLDLGEAPENIPIMKFSMGPKSTAPTRATKLSAGLDLYSSHRAIVQPFGRAMVRTGVKIAIPEGYYGRIAPRSSLAFYRSIHVGAGVIDADFRGAISILLFNFSYKTFLIQPGDKIAQLIIEKIITPTLELTDDLGETERGEGGLGSSDCK